MNTTIFRSLALVIIISLLAFSGALAADGALDPTFGTNGFVITDLGSTSDTGDHILLSPDGNKILALGSANQAPVIARYNIDGNLDTGYGAQGKQAIGISNFRACDFAFQSDGRLIVGGGIDRSTIVVARYTDNGITPDTGYGTNGIVNRSFGPNEQMGCSDLAVQPDRRVVVVGSHALDGSNFKDIFVARFNENGSVDFNYILDKTNFPNNRYNYAQKVAIQKDGKIVILSGMMDDDAKGQIALARLNVDSSMDTTFGSNGKGTVMTAVQAFYYHPSSMAIQADGKIVVAGTTSDVNDLHNDLAVARFNSNGTLDTSFGGTGIVTSDFGSNELAYEVAIQKDGRIVVDGQSTNGTSSDFMLVRYNANGTPDSTFGTNGEVLSDFGSTLESAAGSVLQSDGKLLVVGSSNNDMVVARYSMTSSSTPPVTVTFKSIRTFDGWILESGENSNTGSIQNTGTTTFNVGDDPKNRQYRGFLSFNTASIPDNAAITSAELKIRKQGTIGVDPFTTHQNLLAEIRKGYLGASAALQPDDFNAPVSSLNPDLITAQAANWYSAKLNAPNLNFINRTGVTQFRLRFSMDDDNDLTADYVKFFSGDAVLDTDQPQLVITYYLQ